MMISANSMGTTATATTWVAVEGFPGDQIVQRAQVGGARDADQRADQDGEPEPGLSQHPLRPAVLLLPRWFLRLPAPAGTATFPAVQAACNGQPAVGEHELADGQVDARAHRFLRIDGIGVETSTSSRPIVRATVRPPSRTDRNIARGRRFSISSRPVARPAGLAHAGRGRGGSYGVHAGCSSLQHSFGLRSGRDEHRLQAAASGLLPDIDLVHRPP